MAHIASYLRRIRKLLLHDLDLLRLSSSRAAWHIGQQRGVTGRQQQLHIPPM